MKNNRTRTDDAHDEMTTEPSTPSPFAAPTVTAAPTSVAAATEHHKQYDVMWPEQFMTWALAPLLHERGCCYHPFDGEIIHTPATSHSDGHVGGCEVDTRVIQMSIHMRPAEAKAARSCRDACYAEIAAERGSTAILILCAYAYSLATVVQVAYYLLKWAFAALAWTAIWGHKALSTTAHYWKRLSRAWRIAVVIALLCWTAPHIASRRRWSERWRRSPRRRHALHKRVERIRRKQKRKHALRKVELLHWRPATQRRGHRHHDNRNNTKDSYLIERHRNHDTYVSREMHASSATATVPYTSCTNVTQSPRVDRVWRRTAPAHLALLRDCAHRIAR